MTIAPRRKDAARNEQRIVAAARRLVDEGSEVQLNEVARLAGVGVATVYRHFPTPEALLETVATPCLESLVAHGQGAMDADDISQGLSDFLGHTVDAQLSDPSLSQVAAAPTSALPHTGELKKRLRLAGVALLDRARAEGAVSPQLTDDDLVPLMCGIAYAAQVHGGSKETATASAHRYLALLMDGIRA